MNTYTYVGGNPIGKMDPSGLLEFGVYSVVEGDAAVVFGGSLTGGGTIGTDGTTSINTVSPALGLELGIDIEFGFYIGDPAKNKNAIEIDIDGGTIGFVIGISPRGGYGGLTFGPGTPGVMVNPGGAENIERPDLPGSASLDPVAEAVKRKFCAQNPNARICRANNLCI